MENPEIFKGKTFEGLLKDIYDNTFEKKHSIVQLKDQLAKLINTPAEAAMVIPLVKDLLEIEVKNDEHLVKMATIIQRLMSTKAKTGSSDLDALLTEQEKQDLMAELDTVLTGDDDVEKIKEKAKNVLEVKDEKKDS